MLYEFREKGIGCTTCVGIGGDFVSGMSFIDCLEVFEVDFDIKVVMMIGEIGGSVEEEVAEFIVIWMIKPISVYVVGVTVLFGKKMGHVGVIVSGGKGTAVVKMDVFRVVGVWVGLNFIEVGELMADIVVGF